MGPRRSSDDRFRKHGGLTHQPGHLIDLMATCADVGGARYPETFDGEKITPLEGKSLRPILEGRQRQGHSELFWEHEGNRAVVQGRWKLVSRHPGQWELYDIQADRTEMNNLAGRHAGKVADISAKYEAWAARANVTPWEQVVKAPRAEAR